MSEVDDDKAESGYNSSRNTSRLHVGRKIVKTSFGKCGKEKKI